jgi:ABC-type multidrug transport system fused ATPase/permease subunit
MPSHELRPLTRQGDGSGSDDDAEAGGTRGGASADDAAAAAKPAAAAAAAAKPRVVARLLSFAAEDRVLVACGAVAIVVSSAFDTLLPNFSARALALIVSRDSASGGGNAWEPSTFHGALSGLILCAVLGAATTGTRVWCTALVEVRLIARVQERLFGALLRQDTAFFDSTSSGELASRLTSDVQVLSVSLTTNFNLIMQNSVNLLASVAVMLSVDALLSFAFVLASLFFFALSKKLGSVTRVMQKDIQDATSRANGGATQAISLLRTVRTLGAEAHEVDKYGAQVAELRVKEERLKIVWSVYMPLVSLLNNSLLVGVLIAGRAHVRTPDQAAGFAVFMFYTTRIQGAMTSISTNISSFLGALGAGEAVFALMDRVPAMRTQGGRVPAQAPRGALSYDAVTFGFAGRPLVLRGVSLSVPAGGRVAVVGASGGGKSTLLALALRLYAPASGRVLLDGADVAELDPTFLRRHVAAVTQEPPLFALTIRDNILYNAPPGAASRLAAAVTVSHLDSVLAALPAGLDTLVGERGVRLSGGQKQRVAIARAVVRAPALLVLDEATSALDSDSERRVALALEEHLASRAPRGGMLLVAHRLSTVRNADIIFVLSGGVVAESGTYDALLATEGGLFRALVARQLQGADDGGEEGVPESSAGA